MKSSLVHATILASMDPESDQEEMPIKAVLAKTLPPSMLGSNPTQKVLDLWHGLGIAIAMDAVPGSLDLRSPHLAARDSPPPVPPGE
jgi:hypothetical protein